MKSEVEIEIAQMFHEIADRVKKSRMLVGDAFYIQEGMERLLRKCEELRISRDNWMFKFKELKKK